MIIVAQSGEPIIDWAWIWDHLDEMFQVLFPSR